MTNGNCSNKKFDYVMVFGEGPVKPVIPENEATLMQKVQWAAYHANPLPGSEPDFWIVQNPRELNRLAKISMDKTLTAGEKKEKKEYVRREWQSNGWYAMRRFGRQNALAAGHILYKGLTEKIILSGGRTANNLGGRIFSPPRLSDAYWPSEAELIKDIIIKTYGQLYVKKFGRPIEDVIIIEDRSTNTLENFAYSVNLVPELIENETRVGFLSARHHLKRISIIARRFCIREIENQHLVAQKYLQNVKTDNCPLADQKTINASAGLVDLHPLTEKFFRDLLIKPHYLNYWLGYVALCNNPRIIRSTISTLQSPAWRQSAEKAFRRVGLNFSDYCGKEYDCAGLAGPLKKFRRKDLRRLSARREILGYFLSFL